MLDLKRVTEPFLSRDRPVSSAAPQGDGIGLTIVGSMLARHGGTLTLEPARRHGLRAILTFPATRVIQATTAAPIALGCNDWSRP